MGWKQRTLDPFDLLCGFVVSLLRALAIYLLATLLSYPVGSHAAEPSPGSGGFDTIYGNSAFGAWTNDEFGLPAFRYDGCSATNCEPTDAFHQLGNGNITAIAHKDGYVELFTAKTFYRYANHYDESNLSFSGGFGWVRDGSELWSTLYADKLSQTSYQRLFGMGYYKKTVEHGGLRIEQYVYAAPGADEALLEHLVFTNLSGASKTIQYFDYWDVGWWLVSCNHPPALPPLPEIPGWCVSTSHYDTARVRTTYDAGRGALKATSLASVGNLLVPSLTNDPSPKTAFVAFLGEAPDRYDTIKDAFFGSGPPKAVRARPSRIQLGELANSLDGTGTLPSKQATLLTQKNFALAAGETRELNILYGIAPRGEEDAVIDRYQKGPTNLLAEVARNWAARIPRLELPKMPKITKDDDQWISREMAWSTYYLLSGMLREDFFKTRVINQGSVYQYVWGANAGPRAALRHVLPVIYLEPQTAREVITYYLRAMKKTGELAYATAGYGGWQDMGFKPSDSGLWLLWAAAEYVFATRDFEFLDTMHEFYCEEDGRGGCTNAGKTATAYEILKQAYAYQDQQVGIGRNHRLVRLLNSDWDDTLTSPLGPFDVKLTVAEGESTLNTALAVVAYPMLAALAERRGDTAFALSVSKASAALQTALLAQWKLGKFFNRAYVYMKNGGQLKELGDDNLWLPANAIALIPESLLAPEQSAQLVERMQRDLMDKKLSPLGLGGQGRPIKFGQPGAGFWYSLAGPAVEGLAKQNTTSARDLAWAAFRRQTLAMHAETYPTIWYGVWSGPDNYFTPLERQATDPGPGETWCLRPFLCMRDFPVTNMFSHSEPLLSSVRMAGLSANPRGLTIDPIFPFDTFKWESRAFAVALTPAEIQGRVTAAGDDTLELRVRVRNCAATGPVTVNGQPSPFSCEAGFAQFALPVKRDVPVLWSVQSAPR